jgi:hypothetical protein
MQSTEILKAMATAVRDIGKPQPVLPTEGMDVSKVRGGIYLVRGTYVDSNGEEVDKKHWPEDYEEDPAYRKFHPELANKGKEAKDPGPGFDQFGNPVEPSEEEPRRRRARS